MNSPKDLHDLVDAVIDQVRCDIAVGDHTALVELLMSAPRKNLEAYLPEAPDPEQDGDDGTENHDTEDRNPNRNGVPDEHG